MKKRNHLLKEGKGRDIFTLRAEDIMSEEDVTPMNCSHTYDSFDEAVNDAVKLANSWSDDDSVINIFVMAGEYETPSGDIYGEPEAVYCASNKPKKETIIARKKAGYNNFDVDYYTGTNQINEQRKRKRTIRLNESQIRRIVRESISGLVDDTSDFTSSVGTLSDEMRYWGYENEADILERFTETIVNNPEKMRSQNPKVMHLLQHVLSDAEDKYNNGGSERDDFDDFIDHLKEVIGVYGHHVLNIRKNHPIQRVEDLNENRIRRIVRESAKRVLREEEITAEAEKMHSEISQFIYSSLKRKYGNLLDGDVDDYVIDVPGYDAEYIKINVEFGSY